MAVRVGIAVKGIDHSAIKDLILNNLRLGFASAGDAHGEAPKWSKFVRDVANEPELPLIIAAGDYLPEPTKDLESASKTIEGLFKILLESQKKKILVLGGNYDPLGVSAELASRIGEPLFSIGCDSANPTKPYPGNHLSYGGFEFFGVEGSNPINGTFPGERSEQEIKWALSKAEEKTQKMEPMTSIVVSHVPPHNCGTRDELGMFGLPSAYWGRHVGSTALKEYLHEKRPLLSVCGHVHEGVGATTHVWIDGKPELMDMRMESASYRIALFMKKETPHKLTVCVNHGTLEYWTYMRYRVAEVGDCVGMEIAKRRLGGKDAITRITDGLTGRGSKVIYDKIIDPDNVLNDLLRR